MPIFTEPTEIQSSDIVNITAAPKKNSPSSPRLTRPHPTLSSATIDALSGPAGVATALGLVALGTGGIKPCVSAFGGDQVPSSDVRW